MNYLVRLFLILFATVVLGGGSCTPSDQASGADVFVRDSATIEGDTGFSSLVFTVALTRSITEDVTVDYVTSDGTATAGIDYTASSGTLTITSGTTSNTISVLVNGDTDYEFSESIIVTLSNASDNVFLSVPKRVAEGIIISDDVELIPLNDTGITFGANFPSGNNAGCSGETIALQDCSQGRDVTNYDNSDGHAGFSYTKLDESGNDLPASALSWSCVRDNVSGLTWEVKQAGAAGLHQTSDAFFWRKIITNNSNNRLDMCYGYDEAQADTYCTTAAFRARVNNAGLCGTTDWRLPTRMELYQLTNLNREGPAIDIQYFPNTKHGTLSRYWASNFIDIDSFTADAGEYAQAAFVMFVTGRSDFTEIIVDPPIGADPFTDYSPKYAVRLVRDRGLTAGGSGPSDGPTDGPL